MSRARLAGGTEAYKSGTVAAVRTGGVVTVAYNASIAVGTDIPAGTSTVIATLPAGLRPRVMVVGLLFRPLSTGTVVSGYIAVNTSGAVSVNSNNAIPADGNVYFGSLSYAPAS